MGGGRSGKGRGKGQVTGAFWTTPHPPHAAATHSPPTLSRVG